MELSGPLIISAPIFVEMYIHVLHSGYEFMNPMNACVCLLNTLATMGF